MHVSPSPSYQEYPELLLQSFQNNGRKKSEIRKPAVEKALMRLERGNNPIKHPTSCREKTHPTYSNQGSAIRNQRKGSRTVPATQPLLVCLLVRLEYPVVVDALPGGPAAAPIRPCACVGVTFSFLSAAILELGTRLKRPPPLLPPPILVLGNLLFAATPIPLEDTAPPAAPLQFVLEPPEFASRLTGRYGEDVAMARLLLRADVRVRSALGSK